MEMPSDPSQISCIARLLRSEDGGVAVYAGIFKTLALGGAALAVDFGRVAVLRTQMQDRADAGALAGATQLDGLPDSRPRAENVARTAQRQSTSMTAGDGTLAVEQVTFYSAYEDGAGIPGDDSDSR